MADRTLQDVIDRLVAEGQLTRNTGTNSIKTVKETLASGASETEKQTEELKNAIGKSAGATISNARQLHQDNQTAGDELEQRKEDTKLAETSAESLANISLQSNQMVEHLEDLKKLMDGSSSGGGGFMRGLGALGLGAGALLAGGGILAGGGAFLLDTLEDLDTQKIKDNVVNLLSISKEFDNGALEFLGQGGAFALAMTGLAAGLAVFSVGSLAVSGADYFAKDNWAEQVRDNVFSLLEIVENHMGLGAFSTTALGIALGAVGVGLAAFGAGQGVMTAVQKFEQEGWADKVVANVDTLLKIYETHGLLGAFDAGVVGVTLGALGLGLAAFAVGEGATNMAAVIGTFSEGEFGQKIYNNVETLLSIYNLEGLTFGNTALFPVVMSALGAGLLAFAIGETATNTAAAIGQFSGGNFGQKIYDNVKSLLSIYDLENLTFGNTAAFPLIMGSLSAGLVAFAIGQTAASTSDAIAQFAGAGYAQNIVDNVETLLGLTQLPVDVAKAAEIGSVLGLIGTGLGVFGTGQTAAAIGDFFASDQLANNVVQSVDDLLGVLDVMGENPLEKAGVLSATLAMIGASLAAFGAGTFVQSLGQAGASILNFITGSESPISQLESLAENSDKLNEAGDAIDKVASALNNFASIDVSDVDIDFEQLARNLGEAIPLLDGLANGGKVGSGFFDGPEIDFKEGLLDPSLRVDELVDQINKVRGILTLEGVQPQPIDADTMSAEAGRMEMRAPIVHIMEPDVVNIHGMERPRMSPRELQTTNLNVEDQQARANAQASGGAAISAPSLTVEGARSTTNNTTNLVTMTGSATDRNDASRFGGGI